MSSVLSKARGRQGENIVPSGARVLLQGYYGANNLGDELMLACLNQWLTRQGFVVTVLAEDAKRVEELHGISAEQNYPMFGEFAWVESLVRLKGLRIRSIISRCDAFLFGGGDSLRDSIGWRGFTYQVSKLITALLHGKPVYLVNVGISSPVTWYGRLALRWVLPRCRRIIVREKRSLEVCRELGAGSVAIWAPDIVLSLPEFFPVAPSSNAAAKPYIVVALHHKPDIYGSYQMTESRCRSLAHAFDRLVGTHGLDIVFVTCQSMDGRIDDHDLHRKITGQMANPTAARFIDWTVNPSEIADIFGGAQMVVAMRLHAVVLAKAFDKECVVLPYDVKVSDFSDLAGFRHVLPDHALDQPQNVAAVLEAALSTAPHSAGPNPRRIWPEMTIN